MQKINFDMEKLHLNFINFIGIAIYITSRGLSGK
jgi:hypothetical protein